MSSTWGSTPFSCTLKEERRRYGFEGGETASYYESNARLAQAVEPDADKALAFRHPQLHAGLEIEQGSKLVARTEIVYARQAAPGTG
jgi:hypothetical protein